MRLLGKGQKPIDESTATNLVKRGAKIVDVRSQNEFAKDSVAGAINLPLEDLDQLSSEFKDSEYLLFCSSGTRSHIACERLKSLGIQQIHNLGDLERAKKIVTACR